MPESPFYQQVMQQGIEQGVRVNAIENTLAVLNARFPNGEIKTRP